MLLVHGQIEGDVDCWVSTDGALWELRGKPAPNEPHTIRMNVAASNLANVDSTSGDNGGAYRRRRG